MTALQEAIRGVTTAVQTGDADNISRRVLGDLTQRYERHANAFTSHLGDDRKFNLRAAWKPRELNRYARQVGAGLSRTLGERHSTLQAQAEAEIVRQQAKRAAGQLAQTAAEVRAEYNDKWREFLRYKQTQLDEIVEAKAQLEAQTDILAHSGAVDPDKDRVMYFGGSPDPCEICADLEGGNPYTVEEARTIGGLPHPNCVLPGTMVAAPDITRGYRAWYEGTVVRLTLAGGAQLSVTANHQLLTRHGFAAAKTLCEGDDLLYCPDFQRVIAVNPDDHDCPARVEEIVGALAKAGGMANVCMPVSTEDFHGDGSSMKGEVNVVSSEGLLGCARIAALFKHVGAYLFNSRNAKAAKLTSARRPATLLIGHLPAPHGGVGRGGQTPALFRRHAAHPEDMCFAHGAFDDTSPSEDATNCRIAATISPGDGFTGFSADIAGDDLLRFQNWRDALLDDALFIHEPDQHLSGASQVASNLPRGLTPAVAFDKIVKVESTSFVGHVYDLQTLSSLYLANGVVSSNCKDEWSSFSPEGVNLDKPRLSGQWHVARDVLNVTRQRVRDGSLTLWDGSPRTPAQGWAYKRDANLRQIPDPWRSIPGYVERTAAKHGPPSSVYQGAD